MVFWGVIVQWCKGGLDCNLSYFHLVFSYFYRKANLQSIHYHMQACVCDFKVALIKSIEKLLTYLIAAEYSIQIFLHHDVIVLFPVVDFLILSKTRKTLEH